MAKTDIQKKVDAAKVSIDSRNSETEKADLEMMIPIVGEIISKVQAGLDEAKYAVSQLDPSLPLVKELSQSVQVVEFTLGKKFSEKNIRLQELSAPEQSPAPDPAG